MDKELQKTMYEGVQKDFEEIGGMDLGSEDRGRALDAANRTVDRLNEMKKIELEEQKIKNEKKHNTARLIVTAVTFVGSVLVTIGTYIDSKKFEQEGFMHSTEGGRGSSKKLLNLLDKFKM